MIGKGMNQDLGYLYELTSMDEVLQYLTERADYGHALSKLVVKNANLTLGRAYLSIPKEFRFAYSDLSYGINLNLEIDAVAIFCDLVGRYLEKPHRAVVFENQLERPSDPIIVENPKNVAIFGQEVYHFLSSGPLGGVHYPIHKFIEEPRSAKCDFGILAQDMTLDKLGRTWDESAIALISRATQAILVEVFDGEAYLIWLAGTK
jgi:hypothetical protein